MTLNYIRECVLYKLLLIAVFGGMFAYIPGVVGAWRAEFYDIALFDTLFYGWVIYLFFSSKHRYLFRAYGFIVPIWLLALYLVARVGVEGAGFLWLFVASVLTGTLIGLKEGVLTVVVNAVVLMIMGIGFGEAYGVNYRADSWLIVAANVIVLMVLVLAATSVMIRALSSTIDMLEKKLQELSDTKDATIEAIATLAEYRDSETGYHIRRTKEYVRIIAEELFKRGIYADTLDEDYIDLLVKSAPLHDIGKIGIPDTILLKEGKLTFEEMEEMKKHTVYGRDVLLHAAKGLGEEHFLSMAAEIAYTHQEHWDGSGYPRGLKGEAIPLSGRIMAVADVYDALRSRRPYKKPLTHEESIAFLKAHAGSFFDPRIVDILPDIEAKMKEVSERFADDASVV